MVPYTPVGHTQLLHDGIKTALSGMAAKIILSGLAAKVTLSGLAAKLWSVGIEACNTWSRAQVKDVCFAV